jgi:glycosyltransferase involved in cell wall biosynthesis
VVTTSDAGGVLEFVHDGRNGYVCSAGDATLIAARLDRLHEEPELGAELGRAGRDSVAEIGWDRVVERLLAWV